MPEAGLRGALERNRRKLLFGTVRIDVRLDDLKGRTLGQLRYVVVGAGGAVEAPSVVEPAVDVLEKVCRRERRVFAINRDVDIAKAGLDAHDHDIGGSRDAAGVLRVRVPQVVQVSRPGKNDGNL